MTMLVNLDEARDHLRVSHHADDADIVAKIQVASAIVLTHLKTNTFVDSDGQVDFDSMPQQARIATLLLVDILYRERGSGDEWINRGYLPNAVAAILYPLRDPTIA